MCRQINGHRKQRKRGSGRHEGHLELLERLPVHGRIPHPNPRDGGHHYPLRAGAHRPDRLDPGRQAPQRTQDRGRKHPDGHHVPDEAHERSQHRFSPGAHPTLLPARPELKATTPSATLDTEKFIEAFNQPPVIHVGGRLFPVDLEYMTPESFRDMDESDYVEMAVRAVERLKSNTQPGDSLVFMTSRTSSRPVNGSRENTTPGRPSCRSTRACRRRSRAASVTGPSRCHERGRDIAHHPGSLLFVDTGLARISQYQPGTRIHSLPISPTPQAMLYHVRPVRRGPGGPASGSLQGGSPTNPGPVHAARDPALQPGRGHPAHDLFASRRPERLPLRRAAEPEERQGPATEALYSPRRDGEWPDASSRRSAAGCPHPARPPDLPDAPRSAPRKVCGGGGRSSPRPSIRDPRALQQGAGRPGAGRVRASGLRFPDPPQHLAPVARRAREPLSASRQRRFCHERFLSHGRMRECSF